MVEFVPFLGLLSLAELIGGLLGFNYVDCRGVRFRFVEDVEVVGLRVGEEIGALVGGFTG